MDKKRHYNSDCFSNEFLLSTEETAFQMTLLKQCAMFLVVGAVPFATFAETYNRRFQFHRCSIDDDDKEKLDLL